MRPEPAVDAAGSRQGPAMLASIDALRGYAILLVLLVHAQHIATPAALWLQRAASEGARGVQLFYIVSAFTLTRSLLHRLTQGQGAVGRNGVLGAYAVRRFFRIAPLFYLIVFLNFLDLGFAPRFWAPDGLSLFDIGSALVFLNAWVPNAITSVVDGGWSVAVEANFYVLLPILLIAARTPRRIVVVALIAGIIGHALSELILWQLGTAAASPVLPGFFKFWLPYQFLAFALGIALYFRPDLTPLRRPEIFWPLILLAIYVFFLRGKAFPIKIACLAIFTVLLIENSASMFVNRFAVFAGKISYSLYFLHFFVLRYLAEPLKEVLSVVPDPNLRFIAGYATLIVIAGVGATLTWRFIEQPFIRLGGRIAARIEGQRS
jgi:peptidoglycan/LPS O-acetylase OafA/YrhL